MLSICSYSTFESLPHISSLITVLEYCRNRMPSILALLVIPPIPSRIHIHMGKGTVLCLNRAVMCVTLCKSTIDGLDG